MIELLIRLAVTTLSAVSALTLTVAIFIQEATDPTSLIDLLSKGSNIVLAVVVVGFMFGWIVPGPIYKEALKREEKLDTQLTDARKVITDTAGVTRDLMDYVKERQVPRRGGGSGGSS